MKIKEIIMEWKDTVISLSLVIIAILFLTNTCNRYSSTDSPVVVKERTTQRTKSSVDTVYIERQPIYNEIVREKIIFRDTAVYIDNEKDTMYPVLNFKSKFEDSLISGNILSKIMLDGTLVHQDLKYTPKFPKYITKTDSIFTTHTKYLQNPKKTKFTLGGEVSLGLDKLNIGLSPEVGVLFKQGDGIGVRYDVLNNEIGVRYYRVFNYNK